MIYEIKSDLNKGRVKSPCINPWKLCEKQIEYCIITYIKEFTHNDTLNIFLIIIKSANHAAYKIVPELLKINPGQN